jgi:hypothetical protein
MAGSRTLSWLMTAPAISTARLAAAANLEPAGYDEQHAEEQREHGECIIHLRVLQAAAATSVPAS